MSSLILIPWHLGDRRDVTIHALDELRRLSHLLCEDPESSRRALEVDYRIDCRDKQLLRIQARDPRILAKYLEWMAAGDVGLLAGGGVPCFIDPGAWLVDEARRRGHEVVALAGASALTTILAVSGVEFANDQGSFTFHFFRGEPGHLAELLANRAEPMVIFLQKEDLPQCVQEIRRHRREVMVFLDLAKTGPFPFANRVATVRLEEWDRFAKSIDWDRVSDVSLMAL